MAQASVPVVIRSRLALTGLLAVIAVALAAGEGLVHQPALAQTPVQWDDDNRVTLSGGEPIGTGGLYWSNGIEVPLYNDSFVVYQVRRSTSFTLVSNRKAVCCTLPIPTGPTAPSLPTFLAI